MAYTLTFDYSVYCKVNGVMKDSPYTLSNGDVITLIPNYTDFAVNGTVYSSSVANTIAISNSDINITTNSKTPTTQGPESTINYTEASTPRLSVDVSTLTGWANLAAGSHDITIVAKADGYKDSAPSAAVQVTKAASTKTLKAGTYKWKDVPDVSMFTYPYGVNSKFNFVSNGETFTNLYVTNDDPTDCDIRYTPKPNGMHSVGGEETQNGFIWGGYDEDYSWVDVPAYQTITLVTDQQVSADFYEWAIEGGNLVEQAAGETWVLDGSLSLSNADGFTGIDFISNSTEYDYIGWTTDSETNNTTLYYLRKSDNYQQKVYVRLRTPGSPGGWINGEAYRTLTFATAPTGELLTWLQANGKQRT